MPSDFPENDVEESERRTPLPKFQLLSVYLIQFAEPVTALCIYPFVNQLVRETGITKGDDRRTGYYAGIIESAFFAAESLTVVQWGYLSDRYGRRPILLIAPLGLGCAMFAFGMSMTFWPLVVARCFQGIFNGNIGVSKSILAEMTDHTNRADAYAVMPFVWSIGQTTGPLIGGVLSNAAQRWPSTLGRILYLRTHPYFLPCAVAGVMTFITFVIAYLGLKETLPSLVAESKLKKTSSFSTGANEETPLLEHANNSEPRQAPQFREVLVAPILLTIMSLAFLSFIDMCNFTLLPLMWSTSIPLGGLGLDPMRIGTALGVFGLINASVQVRIMGPVLRRFGARRIFRVSFSSLLFSLAFFPLMKYFAQRVGRVDGIVIGLMVAQLTSQMLLYFAYGTIHVLVVENIPEGVPIGMTNGLAQMVGSGIRSIAPTFASSLFSVSLQRNLAGGNLVYYILIAITVVAIHGTGLLPPEKFRDKRRAQATT
ncbi:hypothetical protein HYPSUDRAFT_201933 [Hypholoma sublateritium FD-334 SS-4]|uniref:Major facilitator superfamily (MFS) profile domain-containing protein n=1 Tax=Hypholoma sublateritium (strain FD-334 SS-4) TaxID=945553 RepID=A0A0D2P2B6_HYPSF|nr:hypothetical protein HYPSUDRAFT_201933 [Hypholoma sublateritium FD-334 SS-4]